MTQLSATENLTFFLTTDDLFYASTSLDEGPIQSEGQYRLPLQVWDAALLREMEHRAIR